MFMKIDLHIHTNFSFDGFDTPKEVVKAALRKKVDCICITDHGEIKGAVEALKYAFDQSLLVLPGIEIATKSGDVLGINVKKRIPDGLSVRETIKKIKKQGGLAIIPHPFWSFRNFRSKKKSLWLADGLEVFNANIFAFVNKKSFKFSKKYGMAFTAGSDAHKAKFVGRAYLEIPGKELSDADVLEEIQSKTGRIKGMPLSFWERIENSAKMMAKK